MHLVDVQNLVKGNLDSTCKAAQQRLQFVSAQRGCELGKPEEEIITLQNLMLKDSAFHSAVFEDFPLMSVVEYPKHPSLGSRQRAPKQQFLSQQLQYIYMPAPLPGQGPLVSLQRTPALRVILQPIDNVFPCIHFGIHDRLRLGFAVRAPILLNDNPERAVLKIRALIDSITEALVVLHELGREHSATHRGGRAFQQPRSISRLTTDVEEGEQQFFLRYKSV